MTLRFSVVTGILLLASALSAIPAGAADLKIAIVDLRRAASDSPHAEAALKKIDREFRKRDRELVAKQKQIREIEEKLIRGGDTMSGAQRQSRERDLRRMKRELQREFSEFQEDRNLRRNEELQKLRQVVIEETHKLANDQKYDLVLLRDVVVFADEKKLDITERVLARLKQRFNRGN